MIYTATMRTPSRTTIGLALIVLATSVGCGTRRELVITTEPSGALVRLNDEPVGRSPVTVPFEFYGVYDVRLQAEGFEPVNTQAHADAPFWEYPGPDLVGELLGLEHQVRWHFDLEPMKPRDPERLLDHAKQMRARVNQEIPVDEADRP